MTALSVAMSTLIDRSLTELQPPSSQGLRVSLAAGIGSSDTTLTLVDATAVNTNDLIEFGSELLMVTAKTTDQVPVLTVSRGYYRSTPGVHALGAVGEVNPAYPRVRVAEAIRRSFARLEALGLPLVVAATMNRVPGLRHVVLPPDTREVLRVSYIGTNGQWLDLPFWKFISNVPFGKVSTGNLLELWRGVADDDDVEVAYRVPYRWSTHPAVPTEAATIEIQEGAEDLPAVYAAAWLVGAREISRQQLEQSTEWNVGEPSRGGISTSFLRLKWTDFYRSLDEAKRLVPIPLHRPYQKMPRFH